MVTGNTGKRPVSNLCWELKRIATIKNRSEQPPNGTNVANNVINVNHSTFVSAITGGGFLKKQRNSLGE